MSLADLPIRHAAFAWLGEQAGLHGDVLPWGLLRRGFTHGSHRVPLVSVQGILRPFSCELPLSIRTGADSPYDDHFVDDRLSYRYQGTDPRHRANAGLREAMQCGAPLVYFHAAVPGRYLAVWPVFIVGDEPEHLRFWVQADAGRIRLGGASISGSLDAVGIAAEPLRRQYATREVQQRLHQRGFRERVLDAYREQCAMCRLRHRNLLDAAHIKSDREGGEPHVRNGLSLCKIHHTAFDVGVLGVRPDDLRVQVREQVLREIDGPMLQYGLQAMHGRRIWTPRSAAKRPSPELLRWKWERFERVG